MGSATIITTSGANIALTSAEDVALVTNSGVNVTITLPDATTVIGKRYDIKKIDSGNNMFIASILNQTLDGVDITVSPHLVSIQNENITIMSDGSNWVIL